MQWFQYGAFCPLFRLHGGRQGGPSQEGGDTVCGNTGGANEIWQFGQEAEAAISKVMHLREQLRPYIMRQYAAAADTGAPIMRPLFYDFWEDPVAALVEDQMMFGPDFLVAPQLDQDATNRSVYLPPLPPPFVWQNVFNTAEQHNSTAGGMHLVVQTPLDTFPLFFRLKTVPGMRPAPPPPPPLPPPACDPSCRQAPTPHSDTVSGTNIAHANASTFHACCLMCTAHVGCGGFVFGLLAVAARVGWKFADVLSAWGAKRHSGPSRAIVRLHQAQMRVISTRRGSTRLFSLPGLAIAHDREVSAAARLAG